MAYGPSGGAFAGLYAANGYDGGDAAETGIAIGDPGTGLTAAWATVAAIAARRRHGVAARVDVAMVEAIAATLGELWMQYAATGESPRPIGNHDPQWAPHGVYATGPDEWLAVACTDDAAYRGLVEVVAASGAADVAALLADDRFATEAGRKAAEAELDEAIAGWVSGRDRAELFRRACRRPAWPPRRRCHPSSCGPTATSSWRPPTCWNGPTTPSPAAGWCRASPGTCATAPNGIRRPAPLLGQHTEEVLAELGFSGEVDELVEAGVLSQGHRRQL